MKNYPKTTLLSGYLPLQSTKGVFIGERGTNRAIRSRASNLGARLHKIAAKMRHLPRFCGNTWEARTAPPAARFPDVPLSDILASFRIWAPGFDEITLQSKWLSL